MSIYIAHRRRKTSNALDTLVLSEQECFQRTSERLVTTRQITEVSWQPISCSTLKIKTAVGWICINSEALWLMNINQRDKIIDRQWRPTKPARMPKLQHGSQSLSVPLKLWTLQAIDVLKLSRQYARDRDWDISWDLPLLHVKQSHQMQLDEDVYYQCCCWLCIYTAVTELFW